MSTKRLPRGRVAGLLLATMVLVGSAGAVAPPRSTPATNVAFVFFDTETTGFSPANDRIIELAAVKMLDGRIVETKSWLIDPKRKIPYGAQRVHGITPEMVKDAPTFDRVYPEFSAFIEGAVLVAHNAPFDLRFMRAEMDRNGFQPPMNPVLDSLKLFRNWYPDLPSHSLETVVTEERIRAPVFHRATDDARYIGLIMRKMFKRRGTMTLSELYDQSGGATTF